MSGESGIQEFPSIETLKKNSDEAEHLIADINKEVEEIQRQLVVTAAAAGSAEKVVAGDHLERERLKAEILLWQQYLTLRQIRNGKLYVQPPKFSSVTVGSEDIIPVTMTSEVTPTVQKQEDKKEPVAHVAKNEKPPAESTGPTKKPTAAGKKEGGSTKGKAPSSTPVDEVVDVGRLDLRIGKIIEVGRHPDADSLYVEKVDVGEPNPRTVVSGLVKHVPLEEMQNRMVVILCNLKPAKMRGVTSEGMVMCASSPEKVEILVPPPGAVPGDLVEFAGITRNADPVLNPKKKIFETVAPDLKTDDGKIATYKGIPFEVKGKGVISTPTLVNVNIK